MTGLNLRRDAELRAWRDHGKGVCDPFADYVILVERQIDDLQALTGRQALALEIACRNLSPAHLAQVIEALEETQTEGGR